MIFDALYRRTPQDKGVLAPTALYDHVDTATAAVSVTSSFQNNDSRWLILRNACITAIPGAAQLVRSTRLMILPPNAPANTESFLKNNFIATAVNLSSGLDWQGEVWVPTLWTIRATCTFDAGAAVNEVLLNLHGILVPPGNILVQGA